MKKMYDTEEQSQWLESIEVDKFNSVSIMLASKLAREIRKRSGKVISLSDENAVRELGKCVVTLGESDLSLIYRALLDNVAKNKEPSAFNVPADVPPKPKKSRFLRALSRQT